MTTIQDILAPFYSTIPALQPLKNIECYDWFEENAGASMAMAMIFEGIKEISPGEFVHPDKAETRRIVRNLSQKALPQRDTNVSK